MARAAAVVAGAAALTAVLLAVFSGPLVRAAAERFGARALPWPGSRVELASVSLSRHALVGTGLRVMVGPGDTLAVDTLRVEGWLGAVTRRPRRVDRVRLSGVRVRASEGSTGWAWLSPFRPDSGSDRGPAPGDDVAGETSDPAGPFVFVDRLELRGGELLATGASGTRRLSVEGLNAALSEVQLGPAPSFSGDSVSVRLDAPGWTDGPVEVAARFGLEGGAVRIDSLGITEPGGGRAALSGRLGAPSPAGRALDLRLSGRSVPVARLHPALGFVDTGQRADLAASVAGTTSRPEAEFRIDLGESGRIEGSSAFVLDQGRTTLRARTDVSAVDVERITGGRAAVDPVSGTLSAELELGDGGGIDGPVTVDLSSAGYRAVRIAGRGNFVAGKAGIEVAATVPGLAVRIDGTVDVAGGAPGYDLAVTTRQDLPAGLVGPAGAESAPWDVRARVRGEGVSRQSVRAEADVELTPSTPSVGAGPVRLTLELEGGPGPLAASIAVDTVGSGPLAGATGRVTASVLDGRAALSGRLRHGPAVLEILRLELDGVTPNRVELAFEGIDPAAYADPLPRGQLAGRATFTPGPSGPGAGAEPGDWLQRLRLGGRLDLAPSTVAGAPVDGTVGLRLRDGRLDYDVQLRSDSQSVSLAGAATMAGGPFELRVTEGRFAAIDPARWGAGPAGRLSGSLEAGYGGAPAGGRLAVALDSGRLAGTALGPGTLEVRVDGDTATFRTAGVTGPLRTAFEGTATRSADNWAGTGALRLVERGTAESDTLALQLAFAAPGPATDGEWRLGVEGTGRVLNVALDSITARLAFADGTLRVDDLAATGPVLELQGGGSLPVDRAAPTPADLVITARTPDLSALLARPGLEYHGRTTVEVRSTGPATALRHEARLGIGGLRGPHVEVDSVEADVVVQSDTAHWVAGLTALVRAAGNRPVLFSSPGAPILAGLGSADDPSEGEPSATGVELELDWAADQGSSVRVARLAAVLDGEDWSLRGPTVVDWEDGLRISGLDLRSRQGRLTVDGRMQPDGPQDLTIRAVALPVQVRRSGGRRALSWDLDLDARLTGPGADPRLTLSGRLRSPDADSGSVVTADWTARGLVLSFRGDPTGVLGPIRADGTLPYRLPLAPDDTPAGAEENLDLTVQIPDVDLAAFAPLMDPARFQALEGRVAGEVELTGSLADPRFQGEVRLTGLGVQVRPLGTVLSGGRGTLVADGQRLMIREAVIGDGGRGRIQLDGEVRFAQLDRGEIDVRAALNRFRAANSRATEAVVSGTITAAGPATGPAVRGRLRIDEASYRLGAEDAPAGIEPVELTPDDYRELERRFGLTLARPGTTLSGASGIDLDLTVSAASNVWVRRAYDPTLAVELAGEVRVIKRPGEDVGLDGSVSVVEGRSYMAEFGRRFEIDSGEVRFDGSPSSVELVLQASYQPDDDVTIELEVRGDSAGFSLVLGSDPEMDETDIISYIVLGRSATDVEEYGGTGSQVAGLGADVALSRITVGVEALAREQLGLDVVEIRQDGLRGLTLEAGRYVTRRLYLGFQQPAVLAGSDETTYGIDEPEVRAEYRFSDWLLANLSGNRSLARFFLGVRHSY